MKLKVFDYLSFLNACSTSFQAQEIASIADSELEKASFVLYGKYANNRYWGFSSQKEKGDTHVILAYAPKPLKKS